jgi:septal ring factor EnvC (AmiA/AmiB activator)
VDKLAFTQQTKRRVINGFVGDLSLELEESEHLLRK